MSLPAGIYEIRFVPKHIQLPFVGGSYATGENINAPIRCEGLNHSNPGEQRWKVEMVQGKQNTYMISYPGFAQSAGGQGQQGQGQTQLQGHGPVIPGWGLGPKKGHNEPVRLTVDMTEWVMKQVDAKNGVYQITEPANGMVGAVHAVAEEDGRLVLKSFPVVQHMHSIPHWQFIPVKN